MAWGITVAPTMPTASRIEALPAKWGTSPASEAVAGGLMRRVS